ncbi:MAG: hypothetical protein WDA53_00610 [Bacillota bacterium]
MKKLLFLYNSLSNELRQGPFGECASAATIDALNKTFQATGHRVFPINVKTPTQLINYLKKLPRPHLAFVYAEGFLGIPETLWDGSGPSLLRQILANYGIPSTHSTAEIMQICRHKQLTSSRLQSFGLPAPDFQVAIPSSFQPAELSQKLTYPLFVKPAGGGASLGIDESSIVGNQQELISKLKGLFLQLGDLPVLIETYLPGREYTIGILGNDPQYVLPPIIFPPDTKVRSLAKKRDTKDYPWDFLSVSDPRWFQLTTLAKAAFDAVGASDVIRIDFKEDSFGNPYIIDINGTPSLGARASLAVMAQELDINYLKLVSFILFKSYLRHNIDPPAALKEVIADTLQKLCSYGNLVA